MLLFPRPVGYNAKRRAMVRKLILILVLATLAAGCEQSRPAEQGASGSGSDDAVGFFERGNAYFDTGDWDKAIAEYDQAIRLKRNYTEAYHARGLAYYHKGVSRMAIADFDQVIRRDPGFAKAYFDRGSAYLDADLYDWAIADFDKAIKLQPDYAEAKSKRAQANSLRTQEYERDRHFAY
jgi:tetratricopeptide (TPR) repeat protein